MLVYRDLSHPAPQPTVLTVGNFDGLHRGHQTLLARVNELSLADGLLPVALTFEPHPSACLPGRKAPPRLASVGDKLRGMRQAGIAWASVLRFNPELAAWSAEEFTERVLVGILRIKHLVVGDDFRFGAGRRGNLSLLETLGKIHDFRVEAVSAVMVDGERVSSSALRQALAKGELVRAERMLGHPYTFCGRVQHGEKRGRLLGFPTANIAWPAAEAPLNGVFAVRIWRAERCYTGVANLGFRSGAHQLYTHPLLEIFLFDFSGDLYGERLAVEFCHKIRDEQSFANLDALKAQISADSASARAFFSTTAKADTHY